MVGLPKSRLSAERWSAATSCHIAAPLVNPLIDVPRPPALGDIACDVSEIALLTTAWTSVWQSRCREGETALAAFPIGQTAIGTNVSNEFTRRRVAAE